MTDDAIPDRESSVLSRSTLGKFATASVADIERLSLLSRFDSKFLLDEAQLRTFVAALTDRYSLLPAAGAPIATYRTIYFDTPERRFYYDHFRGRRPRCKVRIRHYVERQVSFLEVKKKTSQDRTKKHRLQIEFGQDALTDEDRRFLGERCPVDPDALAPSLWSEFRRITLLGITDRERITTDLALSFQAGNFEHAAGRVAVAEMKQERSGASSTARQVLRDLGLHPIRFSKYCAGLALSGADVRTNTLRPGLRAFERIAHG